MELDTGTEDLENEKDALKSGQLGLLVGRHGRSNDFDI